MKNFLVTIAYDGTDYHGWQVQKNGITIQEKIQDAIEIILGKREDIIACSRTDAGVHANGFCFSMKTQSPINCFRFVGSMNAILPDDIAVKNCKEVALDFHARYDCIGKEYIYKIWNSPQRNPFCEGRYLHYKPALDIDFLNNQAKAFCGEHDFSALCSVKSTVEDCVRTIEYFKIEKNEEEVIFKVKGNGFLYNMVRIMVGTLLRIAEGKIKADSIQEIIQSKNRNNAGKTAPPHGLYLNKVFYKE